MATGHISIDRIWGFLAAIPDPEIPVINVVELGVVRAMEWKGPKLEVTITPTYSGCPAMKTIEEDIEKELHKQGIEQVEIKTILSPPWTTDWINEEAREKLRAYGIAPPEKTSVDKGVLFPEQKNISCPNCRSSNTEMKSPFGSTACKALYVCKDCLEPFDYFKCI